MVNKLSMGRPRTRYRPNEERHTKKSSERVGKNMRGARMGV
jgi:hypothetical protein